MGGAGVARCGRGPAAPTAMRASRPPTSTVSPGWATISVNAPANGDGTRRSALSLVISTISSSSAIDVAGLLEPFDDRGLGHRLAQAGQGDVGDLGGGRRRGRDRRWPAAVRGRRGAVLGELAQQMSPISIVSPGWATMRASTPGGGRRDAKVGLVGGDLDDLLVERDGSPGCLSHSTMVASVTDSPRLGRTTGTVSSGTLLLGVRGRLVRSRRRATAGPIRPIGYRALPVCAVTLCRDRRDPHGQVDPAAPAASRYRATAMRWRSMWSTMGAG